MQYYDVIVSWRTSGTVPVLARDQEEAKRIATFIAESGLGIIHDVIPEDGSVSVLAFSTYNGQSPALYTENREAYNENNE